MCTVGYPSSYSSVMPVTVDGTAVTGRSWRAPLDVKAVRIDRTEGGYMSTSRPGPDAPVLLICHICGLVHDDRETWQAGWLSKKAFRDATGIDPLTSRLTHSFCSACYDYFVQKNKQQSFAQRTYGEDPAEQNK